MNKPAVWSWLIIFWCLSHNLTGWTQNQEPATAVRQSTEAVAPAADWHHVQPGDTYFGLAKKYQVPVDSLIKWNGARLLTGTKIRLSAGATTTPSVNTSPSGYETDKSGNSPQILINGALSEAAAGPPVSTTMTRSEEPQKYTPSPQSQDAQRVLIIPFDPYLYFSDADPDIARQSRIPAQNVRYIFRARLNAFLDPKGFESINLLNTTYQPESANKLSNIYQSLAYSYQDITHSRFNPLPAKPKTLATGPTAWFRKQKEKIGITPPEEKGVAEQGGKYYGVKVKDPGFYTHFNNLYGVNYYLFINQFEIHTDYTNCIDRVTQNFEREFTVHYTIYNAQGELIAGNKINIPYVSNINDIDKIVRDNLNKMAQRILSDLPQPEYITSKAATE
ncbi:MAG: hypothetical protein AVDCRST_MAG95-2433 [uncultured Adhaeribacter sp.]|uniref:LysM domain-containing protein n=1 Tax=uncultured Adhaeribacter sp. TaxID=448109 RepID=A0A6J4IZZ3_9BACT|nr:MAG: hypothetical protein AVDCRST_MAG95-2433 [uncultured Adhaeribacter sp.]